MRRTIKKFGKVRWFDSLRGEGLIRDTDGNSFFVHYSAIDSPKKRKALKKNVAVEFELLEDSHYTHISKVKEV